MATGLLKHHGVTGALNITNFRTVYSCDAHLVSAVPISIVLVVVRNPSMYSARFGAAYVCVRRHMPGSCCRACLTAASAACVCHNRLPEGRRVVRTQHWRTSAAFHTHLF